MNSRRLADYQAASTFLIGICAIAIEPIIARLLVSRIADYARHITLSLVFIGTGLMLPEIPKALEALEAPFYLFVLPYGVLLWRYVWQFRVDLREMQNPIHRPYYIMVFVFGLAIFVLVFYFFFVVSVATLLAQ